MGFCIALSGVLPHLRLCFVGTAVNCAGIGTKIIQDRFSCNNTYFPTDRPCRANHIISMATVSRVINAGNANRLVSLYSLFLP